MRRIRVAVEELDHVLGPAHEGFLNSLAHDHAAHRHRAVGDALRKGDDIGNDAVALGREWEAEAAEAVDDLVQDQQNSVFVADRAQPLEITFRRRQYAGRAAHRFDDDGRDGGSVMQRDETLKLVREMRAPFRLALAEGLMLAIIRVREMIDAGEERAELFSVRAHAADGNSAEADAVIAALAADQADTRGLAAHIMIGERDLERGIGGFGA